MTFSFLLRLLRIAPAHKPLSFFSFLLTFPFVVLGQNLPSRCQDAARMFFVSEMFLVKASRPTRCHLLSLSCLSYTSALTSSVATTFLSLPRFFSFSNILAIISPLDTLAIRGSFVSRSAISQDSRNHKFFMNPA